MAGVYINGMEMPKSCYDCELIDIVKDCPHYEIPSEAYCQIPWIRKRRAEGCPLVPVPPHGRLIDADALMEYKSWVVDAWSPSMSSRTEAVNVCDIVNAPTIIPVEEGGG